MRTKRYISLLLAALMAVSLTACGAGKDKDKDKDKEDENTMTIQPAQLSEEETALTELLDLEMKSYRIFDFQVSGAKSITLSAYELVGNDWSLVHSHSRPASDGAGRIALMFGRMTDGVSANFQQDGLVGGTRFVMPGGEGEVSLFSATSVLNSSATVEMEQEIPLAIQIATTQNEINSYDVQYFGMPRELGKSGYEHVYAITVTFSANSVSDSSQSTPASAEPSPAN